MLYTNVLVWNGIGYITYYFVIIIPQGNIASFLGDTIHLKAVLVADSYDWVSVPADNH